MNFRNLFLTALAIIGLALFAGPAVQAQTCDGAGNNFVDLNGDGFNDNAPDLDGDGIPNGLDEDFIKHAQDGDGYQHRAGAQGEAQAQTRTKAMTKAQMFNQVQSQFGSMFQYRNGALGTTGGSGNGVCDGTGGGMNGGGVCDGTGPNGNSQKRGGK